MNQPLFAALLAHETFRRGEVDIHCLERFLSPGELEAGCGLVEK